MYESKELALIITPKISIFFLLLHIESLATTADPADYVNGS